MIQAVKRERQAAANRSNIDDNAALLLAKIRQYLAANVHHAEDVCLKLLVDLFRGRGLKRADNRKPGVIDDGVYAPKFFERFGDCRLNGIDVSNVKTDALDVDYPLEV